MRNDCVFCAIMDGEISSQKVYEDDRIMIIKDINPKAKLHYLCIPKNHFKLLEQATEYDLDTVRYAFKKIPELRKELGLENGYRIIINQDEDGRQTVFHLHIHILGGERLPI